MQWTELAPSEHGDWISQHNDAFSSFISLEPEKKFDAKAQSFFNIGKLSDGLFRSVSFTGRLLSFFVTRKSRPRQGDAPKGFACKRRPCTAYREKTL
jgi:hypothetical protein